MAIDGSDEGENGMFSHIMIGSNDIARSKKFYDALFVAMGGKPANEDAKGRLIYAHNGGLFLVSKPIDGKPATNANGATIGFSMSDSKQADAWHKAGVANGGTAIEDPPGIRQGGAGPMYLAYLRDPDGNKLCALHRMPA
jgi:catechol 2,3-dioxygenase-like lactoylglutathione lyase family enzyme